MTLLQQILDEMKRRKVTAQAPITAIELWANLDDSSYLASEIELELEKMVTFRPPSLSRMQHTKNGVTQMVYWPTGMHQAISYSDATKKVAPTPMRRDTAPPKQEAATMITTAATDASASPRKP